ncbi:hypothetical protein KQI84_12515 [bacterium]|nr:hypothetical protein [bacterium]
MSHSNPIPPDIDPNEYYGTPLVDESTIPSPGSRGKVFNPVIRAEFRRWRARPFTYLGMVLLVLGAIVYAYHARIAGGLVILAGTPFSRFLNLLIGHVVRPSTILPAMMVWRALVSFRPMGLYSSFRTTFLTPGEFLWGIIAVPFFVSALILMGYTGIVLSPRFIQSFFAQEPGAIDWRPVFQVAGILAEGSLNGALICFVALYLGLRTNARLWALFPLVVFILAIQAATTSLGVDPIYSWLTGDFRKWLLNLNLVDDPRWAMTAFMFSQYLILAIPKLILCIVIWGMTTRFLHKSEE